jgi:hypothetical protein
MVAKRVTFKQKAAGYYRQLVRQGLLIFPSGLAGRLKRVMV